MTITNANDVGIHVNMISTGIRGGSTRGRFAAASLGPANGKDDTNNELHDRFFVFED